MKVSRVELAGDTGASIRMERSEKPGTYGVSGGPKGVKLQINSGNGGQFAEVWFTPEQWQEFASAAVLIDPEGS